MDFFPLLIAIRAKGPFKCHVTQLGVGVGFPGKKRYGGVRFNVISVTRVGSNSQEKSVIIYVTLEWPLTCEKFQ